MKDVQIFNSVAMELEKLEHRASSSVSLEVIYQFWILVWRSQSFILANFIHIISYTTIGMHVSFILLSISLLYGVEQLPSTTISLLSTLIHWSLYMAFLCSFHFLEFFSTAVSQPSLLTYECTSHLFFSVIPRQAHSFLSKAFSCNSKFLGPWQWENQTIFGFTYISMINRISRFCIYFAAYIINHSTAYTVAALASWIEFWLEYYFFGGGKLQYISIALGLVLVISGQVKQVFFP